MKLLLLELLTAMSVLGLVLHDGKNEPFTACLPEGISLREAISAPIRSSSKPAKKVTVKQALETLKAHCRNGKLVDGSGKEIYFYRLIGCWGNPPADYQEQLKKQALELERLKKKYTVIEIPCDQEGDAIRIN
jgi:hypothetical protein